MPTKKISTSEEGRLWAAASYLWIISIVVLAVRKNDNFARFHANQGSLLFIISIPMMFIPVVGWLINLIICILAIIGIIKALTGERWELPLLGSVAAKFGGWIVKTFKL